jgi:hypothetical protein
MQVKTKSKQAVAQSWIRTAKLIGESMRVKTKVKAGGGGAMDPNGGGPGMDPNG